MGRVQGDEWSAEAATAADDLPVYARSAPAARFAPRDRAAWARTVAVAIATLVAATGTCGLWFLLQPMAMTTRTADVVATTRRRPAQPCQSSLAVAEGGPELGVGALGAFRLGSDGRLETLVLRGCVGGVEWRWEPVPSP